MSIIFKDCIYNFKLNKGDMLYIPAEIYHNVDVKDNNKKNINLNIIINTKKDCNDKFNNIYKDQAKQCKFNNCI